MIDDIYHFFRGAVGLALMVSGASFLVEPVRQRVHKAFGAMFLALGFVFMFSWLSEYWEPPVALDNLLVILVVFTISQSLFEISLYLFGDEAVRGSRRNVYLVGAVWSMLLWVMPALDYAFSLPVLRSSIEDSRPMALFLSISSIAVYVWPIAITVVSLRLGRWHIADLPRKPGATRAMLVGMAGLVVILAFIGAALLVASSGLYRAGHTALELLMLVWLMFYRARPDVFITARKEIEQRHRQREKLEPADASRIAERLGRAVRADHICANPELNLPSLARALRLPVYRLSAYFNSVLGMSFPVWLNAARVDYVRQLLAEKPDMSILEVSIEAGYSSKTVFNSQFMRRVGMSPSEYRATLTNSGTVSSKQDDRT